MAQLSPSPPPVPTPRPARGRPVYVLFLAATAYTVLASGASPFLEHPDQFVGWPGLFVLILDPGVLAQGLPYAACVLGILGTHEMGHYVACRWYRIAASPPLFLPGPSFPFGTFGAFIRIRAPFPDRGSLFDVGIAGPLAGFALTLPALALGFAWSEETSATTGGIELGESLLTLLMAHWVAPPVSDGQTLLLHPVAYAGWVGLLATALNLLPIGQLDGGHIVYAISPRLHRWMSLATVVALGVLGLHYLPWAFWGLILLVVMGRRHPPLVDESRPPSVGRYVLGLLALVILIVCFIPAPFAELIRR